MSGADNWADAVELAGGSGHESGTTSGASSEGGEPTNGRPSAPSVWYRWVAPTSEEYLFWSQPDSGFDPVLDVFEGDSLTSLAPVTGQQFFYPITGHEPDGWNWWNIGLRFAAAEGRTYYLRYAGADANNSGGYELHWQPVEAGWTDYRTPAPAEVPFVRDGAWMSERSGITRHEDRDYTTVTEGDHYAAWGEAQGDGNALLPWSTLNASDNQVLTHRDRIVYAGGFAANVWVRYQATIIVFRRPDLSGPFPTPREVGPGAPSLPQETFATVEWAAGEAQALPMALIRVTPQVSVQLEDLDANTPADPIRVTSSLDIRVRNTGIVNYGISSPSWPGGAIVTDFTYEETFEGNSIAEISHRGNEVRFERWANGTPEDGIPYYLDDAILTAEDGREYLNITTMSSLHVSAPEFPGPRKQWSIDINPGVRPWQMVQYPQFRTYRYLLDEVVEVDWSPAPPCRLSGRQDGLGPGGIRQLSAPGVSRQAGFRPGGYY